MAAISFFCNLRISHLAIDAKEFRLKDQCSSTWAAKYSSVAVVFPQLTLTTDPAR